MTVYYVCDSAAKSRLPGRRFMNVAVASNGRVFHRQISPFRHILLENLTNEERTLLALYGVSVTLVSIRQLSFYLNAVLTDTHVTKDHGWITND